MSMSVAFLVLLALTGAGFWLGRGRAAASRRVSGVPMHSVPSYYGLFVALWAGLPSLVIMLVWLAVRGPAIDQMTLAAITPDNLKGWAEVMLPPEELSALSSSPDIARKGADILGKNQRQLLLINIRNLAAGQENYVNPAAVASLRPAAAHMQRLQALSAWMVFGLCVCLALAALAWAYGRIAPDFRARNHVEKILTALLALCSLVAIFTTVGIVLSLLFESLRFFARVSPFEFLFGLNWSPQTAIRADQIGSSGAFGAVPLFVGTLLIAVVAMAVAGPVGLLSAVYLSEYASRRVRALAKPTLEILAGVPTVVYGFFAILVVAPSVKQAGAVIGLDISSQSALAAGLVMGVMIIPFVSSLADDVITAVPRSLRDGSLGLGATRSETMRQVILPAALPGIVGAFLLAISRAIGETMIVVMAAGLQAKLTLDPLDSVTTVTVQIKSILVGDQEFDSAKTLSVFALGLVLFIVTLTLNVIALRIVQKYREKYD
jgi:phosphate transport system permease protein